MNAQEDYMTLDDFDFPDIRVDSADIRKWTQEEQFIELAADLFREVAKLGTILSCIMPSAQSGSAGLWSRDQAVFGGLLIRLSKLQMGFLTLVGHGQQEIVRLVFRSLFETAVNLIYMAEKGSPEICEAYVGYSLRSDKDLLLRIDANVRERGHEIPVEGRMRASIMALFEASEVAISDIDSRAKTQWGGSIYQRAKDVGYEGMYLATFSMTSNEVHGNWGDLIFHHLERSDEGFLPETRWSPIRPQEILAAGMISADAYLRYAEVSLNQGDDRDLLLRHLAKYQGQLSLLAGLHEEFVSSTSLDSAT